MKDFKNYTILIFVLFLGAIIGYWISPNSTSSTSDTANASNTTQKHTHEARNETWTCSMHPQIRSPEPGACPICGMDLIPAMQQDTQGKLEPNEIKLSPRSLALAQIRTTRVRLLEGTSASRELVGRVTKNEDQTKVITAWFGGRIEKLKVASEGEKVRKNQVVAYVYSPEIYAAHKELMIVKSQVEKLNAADPFAKKASKSALESARTRLRLLGIRSREVSRMEAAKKAWTRIPIRSSFSGTVVAKRVSEGAYVKEGTPLLEISNLDSVWVELDAYASDIPLLKVGQSVNFEVDSIPNKKFKGLVSFIEPFVDSATRTGTIRVELQNEGSLKPGQYVKATLEGITLDSGALIIPRSAPLYAGKRSIVYIEKQKNPEPIFVARSVKLGQVLGDQVVVLSGLKKGENVVTHGAFTLDADLQIRGGLSLLARPDDLSEIQNLNIPKGFLDKFKPEFLSYLEIQKSLAADSLKDTIKAANTLTQDIVKTDISLLKPKTRRVLNKIQNRMLISARAISNSEKIEDARIHFETLSNILIEILKSIGNPLDTSLSYTFCPMAFENKGAHWIQLGTEIKNAYYGNTMLSCGSVEEEILPQIKLGQPSKITYENTKEEEEATEQHIKKKNKKKVKKTKKIQKNENQRPKIAPTSTPTTAPASAPTSTPTTAPASAPTTQSESGVSK